MKNSIKVVASILIVVIGYLVYDYFLAKIDLQLSTGKVENGVFIPATNLDRRRVATLRIGKSYITWRRYLDGKPRNRFHFDAALPSLQPNKIYKLKTSDSIDRHKQWVRIDVGVYGFSNQLCESECTREEHNEKVLERKLTQYNQLDSNNHINGLKKYVSDSLSLGLEGREFYVPIDKLDIKYVECNKSLGNYRWCTASHHLNNNIFIRYQFEYKYLDNWKGINNRISVFANNILVSHNEF